MLLLRAAYCITQPVMLACVGLDSGVARGVRQADDRSIKEEGLDNLSEEELRSACRARGMRAPYGEGAAAFMRRQLAEWLDLSLNRRAPGSPTVLSLPAARAACAAAEALAARCQGAAELAAAAVARVHSDAAVPDAQADRRLRLAQGDPGRPAKQGARLPARMPPVQGTLGCIASLLAGCAVQRLAWRRPRGDSGADGGGGAAGAQVIEDVSLQAEGADDYERKLTQLRREEELIHEEAREAAAVLRADMPTLRTGEARWPRLRFHGLPCLMVAARVLGSALAVFRQLTRRVRAHRPRSRRRRRRRRRRWCARRPRRPWRRTRSWRAPARRRPSPSWPLPRRSACARSSGGRGDGRGDACV